MTVEQDIERGRQAETLLESHVFKEACEAMARRILDTFAATDPRKVEELAYQRRLLQTLADFKLIFGEFVRIGKNAEAKIRDTERKSKLRVFNG